MKLINEAVKNVEFKVTDEAKEKVVKEIATTDEWIDLNNKIIKMLYVYSGYED